jgi:hypothetical protein
MFSISSSNRAGFNRLDGSRSDGATGHAEHPVSLIVLGILSLKAVCSYRQSGLRVYGSWHGAVSIHNFDGLSSTSTIIEQYQSIILTVSLQHPTIMESLSHIRDARSFVIWILCLWLSYKVIQYCLTTYRRTQHARKHGCKPAASYPHIDPIFGLDSLYRSIKAIRRGHLMDEFDSLFKKINGGVDTYSSVLLGSRNVHTIDPENVKAILRTNWKDYGHSAPRKAAFGYFGKGIFTAEGPEWEIS